MSDDEAVSELHRRLLTAWNSRDDAAMAECFSDDGLLIGFDGSVADGREAILDHLTPIFADHPTAAYVAIVRSVRRAGDASVLLADAGMVPPGADEINPEANARQTVVAASTPGGWRVTLFQTTPAALHWDDAGRQALTAELDAACAERGPLRG
ncbi:uncharacterized protein (TIGR02246 family) [Brevibacterium sanguinis]|uniref:Uncharacterized protein (TIGR02246 family) n=2 Tax=Brevibacterium TaxID=1696 RepID=A0A366IJJ4_9MICO|nr:MULTISPECIES: SgcJ/EcaC family oxidoreductase [Brevibacterium]RBP65660.1 uncharacterized protein (TIGR02246 family) [Brevibacterium sanguinis]RBP72294.1 uncharacterized protein (TIGR02246 family) [Brevibacterium celere]